MADQGTIERQVRSLIHEERPNTVLAHFQTCIHGDAGHYFGNITGNKFHIWYARGTTLGYHPVVHGEVRVNEYGESAVSLKPVLNPFGYFQLIVGTIVTIFLIVFNLPSETTLFINSLISVGIIITMIGIVHFIYKYETKYHLDLLKKQLSPKSK